MAGLFDFALPDHDRRLLPEGRIAGQMPWVLAIMIFLTLLAAAAGIVMARAATSGSEDLSSRATVQILEAEPAVRAGVRGQVTKALTGFPGVVKVTAVSDERVRQLLLPWLGDGLTDGDIPIPALVDVAFASAVTDKQIAEMKARLKNVSADIRIDSHASWMAPFFALMQSLLWLCLGILLLLLFATSATIILAVRAAMNTHKATIEIMHLIGATDFQLARLFQRRVALDTLQGGLVGLVLAIAVILLLAGQFGQIEAGLFSDAAMPWYGWILLALVPILITGLSMIVARRTVLTNLKQML